MAEGQEEVAERPTCPQCGSSQLSRDNSRLVCTNCGNVVRENIKNLDPEWRGFTQEEKEERSRAGPPITLTRHDKGLSTDISKKNRDAKGEPLSPDQRPKYGRMRKMDWRGKFDKDRSRMLMYALNRIFGICSQLGFPDVVRKEASKLYRNVADADIVRGRSSDAAAGAVVYIACIRNGVPAIPKEIIEYTGASRKSFWDIQRLAVQNLGIDVPSISPAKYVPKVVSYLEASLKMRLNQGVSSAAKFVVHKAKEEGIAEGRSKLNVAASAVYLVLKMKESYLSLDELADSLDITTSTLRKISTLIEERVDFDEVSRFLKEVKGGEKT